MNIRVIYWIILLSFLHGCTSKSVDNEEHARNDSIQKYLDLAENDTFNSKLRNKYNDKAFSLVDLSKNDTLTRFYLSSLSFNYMKTKNEKGLRKIGKIHFEKSSVAKDTLNLARYYRYKAGYLKNTLVYDSSYYFYLKAEKFYKKTNDEKSLAIVYNNKRIIQYRFDDYLGANLSAKIAYRYFKKTNNLDGQYNNLVAIGNNYVVLREYKNAINAFGQALNILKNDNSIGTPGTCLNNIGNAYREQKMYSKAIYYLNLALKEKNLIKKDPCLYGFLLNNLSYCKLQLKDYSGLPNMLFKSIELMKEEDGIKESIISYLYLSNYFLAVNDTTKSKLFAEKALKIAKKTNASYYYLTALSNAGAVDNKKASKYIQEYHKINDSLFFIENNTKNIYYNIQFDTDEITQEKDKAISQKWIITTIASVLILFVLLIHIITRQRAKQKELQLVQEQQKANEEIYELMLVQKNKEELARQGEKKRIALELHDGVMNKLASTRLNLNVLSHQKDDETINKCLVHIEEIYKIEQEIRNITHNLTLDNFKDANTFVALLNDFIATQNTASTSQYSLETDKTIQWNQISSGIKINLYRIIQEASHNVNKYAEASNVLISLILDENNICLSVTDNGKGFDPNANMEGIGLRNIKHRVESLRGKVVIQSNSKSTSINLAIPFVFATE